MVPRSGLLGDVHTLALTPSLTNRLDSLSSYPRNPAARTICGGNKEIQSLKCGFQFFNGTTVFSSALSMVPSSSWCGRWTQCSHLPTCGQKRISIFSLVQVIDGGSRAFTVLWLDHVARTHEPDCSDNSDEKMYNSFTRRWWLYRDMTHTGGYDQVQNYKHVKLL